MSKVSLNKRLGVNIDHVATLRQARGTSYPDIVEAALEAEIGGADQITVHLREDRRHIQDADLPRLQKAIQTGINLEMAATEEMKRIAISMRPRCVCLVPEKREEKTTEGGLTVKGREDALARMISDLSSTGIQVSLFIEPDLETVCLSQQMGAHSVEFHTGRFCIEHDLGHVDEAEAESERVKVAAIRARELGLNAHAGHGLNLENIMPILAIEEIQEFNIGHSIVARALFKGLSEAVREMRVKIDQGSERR